MIIFNHKIKKMFQAQKNSNFCPHQLMPKTFLLKIKLIYIGLCNTQIIKLIKLNIMMLNLLTHLIKVSNYSKILFKQTELQKIVKEKDRSINYYIHLEIRMIQFRNQRS